MNCLYCERCTELSLSQIVCNNCKVVFNQGKGLSSLINDAESCIDSISEFLRCNREYLHDVEQKDIDKMALSENESQIIAFCVEMQNCQLEMKKIYCIEEFEIRQLLYRILIELKQKYAKVKKLVEEGKICPS